MRRNSKPSSPLLAISLQQAIGRCGSGKTRRSALAGNSRVQLLVLSVEEELLTLDKSPYAKDRYACHHGLCNNHITVEFCQNKVMSAKKEEDQSVLKIRKVEGGGWTYDHLKVIARFLLG